MAVEIRGLSSWPKRHLSVRRERVSVRPSVRNVQPPRALERLRVALGAGIRYNAGRIGIGLEYNGTFSKAFDSNNVSAKLSIAF